MRKSVKVKNIESKYGMDIKDILTKKYYEENKSLKQIGNELGFDKGNLSRMFDRLNIPKRNHKEAFKNWWDNSTEDEKKPFLDNAIKSSEIMQTKESRDKLREVMKTKEYKRKISKANSGKKNAMYNPDLSKDHRDKTRLVFGYKKWSLAVRERDNFTCQVCGLKTNKPGKLHAHHLESFDTNEELRTDIKNGITLCNSCHNSFHNRYKGQKTNKKQFIEFQAEKCL